MDYNWKNLMKETGADFEPLLEVFIVCDGRKVRRPRSSSSCALCGSTVRPGRRGILISQGREWLWRLRSHSILHPWFTIVLSLLPNTPTTSGGLYIFSYRISHSKVFCPLEEKKKNISLFFLLTLSIYNYINKIIFLFRKFFFFYIIWNRLNFAIYSR